MRVIAGHRVRPALSCVDVFSHVLCRRGHGGRAPPSICIPSTRNAASTPSRANSWSPAKRSPVHHMAVLRPWTTVRIEARSPVVLVLLGGSKLDGERLIWWNFVASSKELIDSASARWQRKGFAPVPDETEFIPLPEKPRADGNAAVMSSMPRLSRHRLPDFALQARRRAQACRRGRSSSHVNSGSSRPKCP